MNLTELVNNPQIFHVLAHKMGIDDKTAQTICEEALPTVAQGIRQNVANPQNAESLWTALSDGHHEQFFERPEKLEDENTIQEGKAILGHVFGSKEVSRELATRVADQSNTTPDIVKKVLPMLAAAAMGALSKQVNSGGIKGLSPQQGLSGEGITGLLSFLDVNKNGSIVDDVLNFAKGFIGGETRH